ncbi:MAG: cytochrome c [Acidobacteria bacterium]|nr:cytochrome c [Acidobacteriota bacterium]
MQPKPLLPLLALLAAGVSACSQGRHSASGFRLPENGDPARGQMAFVALECHSCHQVKGAELPAVESRMKAPVVLGGQVPRTVTDGYLVSSVINPNYKLASYPPDEIAVEGKSRMPDYTDKITARQLTDVVAFLQAHYEVVRPSREYPVYY